MSAFHRFLFSIFLFLALGCFWASSAFAADVTFRYYQSTSTNTYCTKSQSDACSRFASDYSSPADSLTRTVTYCGDATSRLWANVHFKRTYTRSNGTQYDETAEEVYQNVANALTLTCPEGSQLKLTGCNAECVVDPCNALKDQEFSGLSVCGSFSCSDGGVIQGGSCSRGKMLQSIGSPDQNLINDQCIGTFDRPNLTTRFYNKTDDEGKSSGSAYCSAFYKYNGLSATDTVADLNLAALSAANAVPLPASGVCPADKPLKSKIGDVDVCIDNKLPDSPCPVAGEKPNANGVCVAPDDPTYPDDDTTDPKPETGCPSGQIRNNSGVCVPYADATKCPVGQIRDNLGLCSNDPKANSCPVGQVKNVTTGLCSNDPRGTGCAGGALPDKSGMCPNGKASCPIGKTRDSSGMCVGNNSNDPPDGTGCKDGSTADALGKCADGSGVCPSGQIRNSLGKCVVDDVNTPKSATASNDCLVSPECSGDIVQCGLIQQNWQTGCDLQKALTGMPDGLSDKLAKIGTSSNDSRIGAASGSAENALTQLSQKIGFSNSACLTDISIQVLTKSIVIPISQVCDLLKIIRLLLHLATYFFCLRMLWTTLVTI